MKRSLLIVFLVVCTRAGAQSPKVFIINADRLLEVKRKAAEKDKTIQPLLDGLRKKADALLDMKPVSVMDKAFTPASGSKHDYMSQAPYFWYDSTKPNGLPYMRKDGVRNPEINKITDHKFLGDLDNASRTLALAWYFTGEEKYANKAAMLLRAWFLDDVTKMNPNLEYGQAIPGVNTGRGIGIIETVALTGIADAAGLLIGSKSWTEADHRSLQQWYTQYLHWLLSSKNGSDEHKAKNNHGTWYHAQAIDFALFTGNNDKAKELVEESKRRLDSQLTKEGKQPLELERTNALSYSTMDLRGWFTIATLAEKTKIDLWNYQTPQGAGINTALSWLAPYAMGEKIWDYQQINKYNKNEIYPLLLQSAGKYKENNYGAYITSISKENSDIMNDLLYGR